ncbi:MAG: phenylacetate--CoA ligase family protein [Hyphomicrobiales bacterium]
MSEHYDSLETRNPAARQRALLRRLPRLLARSVAHAPGWARHLAGVDPAAVTSREALAELPVLRKPELKQMQADDPPFAGFAIEDSARFRRIFMSPGPIFEPMGGGRDPWRTARALFAAGFRPGDVVHNAFAYHLTPGGFILDAGARALDCAVVPAGIGNTEQQVEAIAQLRPVGYCGTPDFLKVLLDKADELRLDASSITRALVSGGALFPSLRQAYAERGVRVLQCYVTADVGLIAYESDAMEGMIVDEHVIVEIVRPGTGEPVADGEVGEVVVTNFNPVYPMIRLATGDLSAVLPGRSPCGRTNMRIRGWLGRADQTAKVKGMFVHPSQVAEIATRHEELARLRLVVGRRDEQDVMTLQAECGQPDPGLAGAVEATLQAVCKVRGSVELVAPGSLPNDGKVIADERKMD